MQQQNKKPAKKHNSLQGLDLRIFVAFLAVLTVVYVLLGYFVISTVTETYYEAKKDAAGKLVKGYLFSLTKNLEAERIINSLLENKLQTASRVTAGYPGRHSNIMLQELAETYEVDEIFLYNDEGVIICSNKKEFIGWEASEGHPVYDFMTSSRNSFVGPVRQNTVTGIYHKYGYFKTDSGYFVQIGILAETLFEYIRSFELDSLIREIARNDDAERISLISTSFRITESTDAERIGSVITDQRILHALQQNTAYTRIVRERNTRYYETYIPVVLPDKEIAALSITCSLAEAGAVARRISLFGLAILSAVYLALFLLLTASYRKDKKLLNTAYLDSLTKLPNYRYLREFLDGIVSDNKDGDQALILLRCSSYRHINASWGSSAGNACIVQASHALQKIVLGDWADLHGLVFGNALLKLADVREKLFAYADDTFAVYIKNFGTRTELAEHIRNLVQACSEPVQANGKQLRLEPHAGIDIVRSGHSSSDEIIQHASAALHRASAAEYSPIVFYDESVEAELRRKDKIENELYWIIRNPSTDSLQLEYQPVFDAETGKAAGFEALARLYSAELGFVPPEEFIEIAEQRHLILPLEQILLTRICSFIRTLKENRCPALPVAANVSGLQLQQPDLTEMLMQILQETGISPSLLKLEITESVFLGNFEPINHILKQLKESGVSISLDDFGTGYSSFARLREMEIDEIKIDKMLIGSLLELDPRNSIIGDMISMAHKIGLTVTAEGVEHEAQKAFLMAQNCDLLQGFLLARPLNEKQVFELLGCAADRQNSTAALPGKALPAEGS